MKNKAQLRILSIILALMFGFTSSMVVAFAPFDVYKNINNYWSKAFSKEKQNINKNILKTNQNAVDFLFQYNKNQYTVKPAYQKFLRKHFLSIYYTAWTNPYRLFSKKEVYAIEVRLLNQYLAQPGWSENRYQHSSDWVRTIQKNMTLTNYPNFTHAAIVVQPTNLRVLPTNKPSYENRHVAGQGYPFDNLQVSLLRVNVPVYVLHLSKDGLWYLVLTPNATIGWVKAKNIGLVTDEFKQQWPTQQYVAAVKDGKPVRYKFARSFFKTRIGEIYPLLAEHEKYYIIQVAVADDRGYANIKHAHITKTAANIWPLKLTSLNIAILANQFLGIPYGWGDLYGYRDCSTTIRDLYAAFSIWLPRNSSAQASVTSGVNLQGLDSKTKMKIIKENGTPFFNLLWLHGHITIYIGQKNKTPYILHSPWGIHTTQHNIPGRVVIGRTVITPVNLGQGYLNVKKTWINEIDKLIFLVPPNQLQYVNE